MSKSRDRFNKPQLWRAALTKGTGGGSLPCMEASALGSYVRLHEFREAEVEYRFGLVKLRRAAAIVREQKIEIARLRAALEDIAKHADPYGLRAKKALAPQEGGANG